MHWLCGEGLKMLLSVDLCAGTINAWTADAPAGDYILDITGLHWQQNEFPTHIP